MTESERRREQVRAALKDLLPALREVMELHPEFFDVEIDGFDENASKGVTGALDEPGRVSVRNRV